MCVEAIKNETTEGGQPGDLLRTHDTWWKLISHGKSYFSLSFLDCLVTQDTVSSEEIEVGNIVLRVV
jgi:hypothetical protein